MREVKIVVGVIGAAIPIIYCGGLLYYFIHNSGSVQGAQEIGLGPTILGLGIIGILFLFAFMARIIWMVGKARSSGEPRRAGAGASAHDSDGDFDADTVIARHMARRSADAGDSTQAMPLAGDGGGSEQRATFGRRKT
jgi:hypothetical protein